MTTATKTDWSDVESMAEQLANNHESFDSFAWFNSPDDAAFWALIYTHNRDSGTIDRANAESLAAILSPYVESGEVVAETHNHWAVGWVEGYAIRVYEGGEITDAFRAYCEAQSRIDDYPVLDEEILSRIEQEEIDESWDSWIGSDFERELERKFDNEDFDFDGDKLRELFDKICGDYADYPYHTGSEVCVDMDKVVEAVTLDHVREFARIQSVRIFRDGYVFTDGTLHCGEYASAIPLYDVEFAACMDADDRGESSVTIDGHEFTWTIE